MANEIDPVDVGHIAHDLNRIADALERMADALEGRGNRGPVAQAPSALSRLAPAGAAPPCELCGGETTQRMSKKTGKPFWGCTGFPDCKGFGKRSWK